MTGPTAKTRAIVTARAAGHCERCGRWVGDTAQQHHRTPRGMGGSRTDWINRPPNLLLLDLWCHQQIERHRSVSEELGYLVRRPAVPADVPVLIAGTGWVLLTDEGGYDPVEVAA